MITAAEIEFYREHGYLGIDGVFSPAEVDELSAVTDRLVARAAGLRASNDTFDLESGPPVDMPRVATIKHAAAVHETYLQALRHPGMLDIVAALIGPAFRYNSDKLNLKPSEALGSAGPPATWKWAQPWAFFPHTNDAIVVMGIAIDASDRTNGCLHVVPGSHLGPHYDHHEEGRFAGKITDPRFNPESCVAIELKAGGVSLRHVRLARSAPPNRSGRPRRNLFFHFNAADAWPLTADEHFWERYVATFVRGRPTAQPRLAALPVVLPFPRSQGSKL